MQGHPQRKEAIKSPDLEGEVVDVSGLETGSQRWIEGVPSVPWHGKPQGDDAEVLTHAHDLPRIQLLLRVLLSHTAHNVTQTVAHRRSHLAAKQRHKKTPLFSRGKVKIDLRPGLNTVAQGPKLWRGPSHFSGCSSILCCRLGPNTN